VVLLYFRLEISGLKQKSYPDSIIFYLIYNFYWRKLL